ncbi:hypothetical protein D3C79_734710 [compost metagenome]
MLFQPACHLTVGPAIGQYPNRGPVGAAVWRGVSMNGDQHVGTLFTRHVRTPHHRDEVIACTRQHRFELRIGIQHGLQTARDADGNIFLFQAVRADSARILPAVTGINRHHHPIAGTHGNAAAARRNFRCGARYYSRLIGERIRAARRSSHRCRFSFGFGFRFTHHRRFAYRVADHYRGRRGNGRRRSAHHIGVGAALGGNGKYDGINAAVLARSDASFRALSQIKHQPHALSVFRRTGTDAFYQVLSAKTQRQAANLAFLVNVQDHAVRAMQREEGVIRRTIEAHRYRGFSLGIGHFDIRQRRCRQRTGHTKRPQYGDQGDYE